MNDDILIVGAGIGGLATGISLAEAGSRVHVFESAAVLMPLGVGINLLPHAVRELAELGLLGALEAAGVRCHALTYYTKRGEPIWSEPRGLAAGYRWPQISIHRGVLQTVLLDEFRARVGADRLHPNHTLTRFDTKTGYVEATFANARGRTVTHAGRLLIGADGIHSNVRAQLHPLEGPPRWNGAVMWRGIVDAAPLLDGRTMIMAGHERQKFVCYPITDPHDGRQRLNFVAELRFDTTELTDREDWNKAGKLEDFLPAFEQWRFPWLDVRALIAAAPRTWVYPMVDRDPLPRWSSGPVTLLGDAAHPMYPIGSNGASQAILDARVLTGCLRARPQDPERALLRYDEIRREATAAIVLANRGQGPETAMQLVETRAPNGFARLSDVISDGELTAIADNYKQIAGFAIEELNNRGSLADPIE
jgi:2-polyprenyl-6-methoxyphenol hydroxylase-like FAD-dependent oxidoreductase